MSKSASYPDPKPRIRSRRSKAALELAAAAVALAPLFTRSASAADTAETTWIGGTTNWSTTTNWGGSVVPSSTLSAEFNATTTYTNQPTLTGNSSSQGIWDTGAPGGVTTTIGGPFSLTITGNATLDGIANAGIVLDGTGNNSLSISSAVTGVTTTNSTGFYVNNAGTLSIAAPLSITSGTTLTLGSTVTAGTGSIVISGNIASTTGALAVSDSAGSTSVTLSGVNSYSGGTTVNSGLLRLSGAGTLGSTSAALVVNTGGTLDLNGTSQTISGLGGSGTILNNSGSGTSTLTDNADGGNAFGGVIADHTSGSGTVALNLTGTDLTLNGASNTYSGGTTISGIANNNNYLWLRNAGATAGTGPIVINANSYLLASSSVTITANISGNGSVGNFNFDNLGGALMLTGNLSYTGPTIFYSNGAANVVNFQSAGNSTLSGVIGALSGAAGAAYGGTSAGSIIQSGTGTLTLSASNVYTGGTTISAGTLQTGNNNALGTGTVTLAGGTLSVGSGLTHSNNLIASANTNSAVVFNGGGYFSGSLADLSGNLTGTGTVNFSDTSGTQGSLDIVYLPNATGFTGTMGVYTGTNNVWYPEVVQGGGAAANWVITGNGSSASSGTFLFADGAAESLGSLSGNGTIGGTGNGNIGTTWSIGALNSNTTFSGLIIDANGATSINKVGTGVLTLTGSSSYSGGTTVNAGQLRANNATGPATGIGNLTIAATPSGNYTGGLLGGNGTVSGAVTLTASSTAKLGGIIAAGANSTTIGTLTTGAETWNGGAAYEWKISSAGSSHTIGSGNSTTAGAGTDDVSMSGLTLNSGNTNAPFTIALTSLSIPSVANGEYSWTIAQVTGGAPTLTNGPTVSTASGNTTANLLTYISGTNKLFALDTSGFTLNGVTAPDSSGFSLEFVGTGSGDNLVLDYAATPEPVTSMLVLGGAAPMLIRRRRRQKSTSR